MMGSEKPLERNDIWEGSWVWGVRGLSTSHPAKADACMGKEVTCYELRGPKARINFEYFKMVFLVVVQMLY